MVNGPLNSALNAVLGPVFRSILGTDFKFPVQGISTYVTYDSGNLPLLEPFHMLPRLLGYTGLADITTPVADSFESALTQLVALGYQDVKSTTDANGVMTFTRGMDMAAVQTDVFRAPTNINWAQRFEVPQTVFNALIDGFSNNLLSPEKQRLTLFGNSALGDAIYKNALVISVAHAVRDGLTRLKSIANPMFNQAQNMLKPVADALDAATVQVNRVIDQGRAAIKGLNIDASKPLFDANRAINESTKSLDKGLLGAVQSAGAHAVAARSTAALIAMPETLPKPQQLTAGTPDLASHLLGTSGSGKEKEAAAVNGGSAPTLEKDASAALSASKPSVVVDSESSAPHAAESVKDTAKVDLKAGPKDDAKTGDRPLKPVMHEEPRDKPGQSLKKPVTDTQDAASGIASATTNTDASAVAKTDGTKPIVDAASKASKSKQDNDSGQHQEVSKDKGKPAKPVVKEKLQDKVDKANSALKDSATGSIRQTRGAITSTVTNTIESATSTQSESKAAEANKDSGTSSVAKGDSDSGKHREDSSGTSNKVKVKVASPSESGGKHRAPEASSGGGSGAGGGSEGSGAHGGSSSSAGKHSASD
ncbi:hypothetical protein R2359_12905 [Mycobacteroides chelonae]|nr:hypothetical protein [Mycobacteroides chelonae]